MNSVIYIEEIMDRWQDRLPIPTVYYRCPLCECYFKDIEGTEEVLVKDGFNEIKMINGCQYCKSY